MYTLALAVLFWAACLKWGAWRRWKEYYPTILYMIIGNLTYAYMFYEYQLWTFDSFMGDSFTCLLIKDLIYPPAVILFLTHYPEGAVKRIVYISGWAAAGTLLEFIAFLLSGIYYDHGWNIWWSFALLVIAFALVRLHYRKPLLVWLPSLACGIAVSFIFGLPFPR